MSDPTFREATAADWDAIWPIVREVLRLGETFTYPADWGKEDARSAWMPDSSSGRRTFVAELDGEFVATGLLRPVHPGPGNHVANAGWMVSAASAGRGIGRALAEYVIEEARRSGFTAMQFNAVVATNRRAIALWKSLGFQIVGTVPGAFRHPEHGPTDLHIMHREL